MKVSIKIAGCCSLILLLFFLMSDPRELPSVMLIVPFALLFLTFFLVGLHVLNRFDGVAQPKRRRIGVTAAAVPVTLLVLQSLGQLTVRDVLAIGAIAGITYFYLSRFGVQPAR